MSLHDLEGSATLEIVNLVLKKQASGEKVLSLAVGEPVYDTPKDIIKAALEGMNAGMTHYTSSYGIPEVRSAIVKKVARKNHINCAEENTIFLASKMSIYATFMALAGDHGSEVLVPDPGYFYSDPAILAGLKPVSYNLNPDYSLNIGEIKKKISKNTKAIIINTPSNPTGKVYGRRELEELYSLCSESNLKIISDEAYEDLVYDKQHVSVGSLEDSPGRVISIFTLSKSYSMTGWRAGYVVAEKEFIRLLARFMEHAFTCFPPFIQHASAVALNSQEREVEEFRKEFLEKRNLAFGRLKEIPNIEVNSVEGAFYIFPKYNLKIKSIEMSRSLLSRYNVAVLPGSVFGRNGENHFRISYSGDSAIISEAMDKLSEFFRKQ